MISRSTTERWPHSSQRLFCVSLSTARVAAMTCGPRLPAAPCSPACGGFEWSVVVVDISLSLLEDLDKDLLQVRLDRLDRDQWQMLRMDLGEQVVELLLVRDRPAYATLASFGGDREAVKPRRGVGREWPAQPDLIGILAEASEQFAHR